MCYCQLHKYLSEFISLCLLLTMKVSKLSPGMRLDKIRKTLTLMLACLGEGGELMPR